MGDRIKTAIEIAMEKAEAIGNLSEKEKEKLENEKKLKPMLASFFKGEKDADDLYKMLKGSDLGILKDAQKRILDSITLGSDAEEIDNKKNGIIAIESLKKEPNINILEQYMNELSNIKTNFAQEKEQVYQNLKIQIEQNPKARLREVKQGQKKATVELSVEEAIRQNPQWQKFQSESEKKYSQEFKVFIGNLKDYLSDT